MKEARVPREHLPRLGFLGAGWIGRARMEAVQQSGAARVAAVCEPAEDACRAALETAPEARVVSDYDALLQEPLDGIVIATPSALHAEQSLRALERGLAVFCQKPLARSGTEAARVVEAARRADRRIEIDLCYRHTEAARRIRELVVEGALGEVYAAELVFHNAYGPDKDWYYDRARSGGGCVMDLGIHLADLALWMLDFPAVEAVRGHLYAGGERIEAGSDRVEDHAMVEMELAGGATVRLACSWNLHAGTDAIIGATFYGDRAAAGLRNVDGSFYDLVAERFEGRERAVLAEPPDAWGGRAVVAWARRLAADPGFDPEAERLVTLAGLLDRMYGREPASLHLAV